MKPIDKLSFLTVVVSLAFLMLQPILAEDSLNINAKPFELRVVHVKTGATFPVAIASGSVISPQADQLFSLGAVEIGPPSVGLKVECEVRNLSDKTQSFRIADLKLRDTTGQNDFFAVGTEGQLFGHTDADRKIVRKKTIMFKPKEQITITYLFGAKENSPFWRLTYMDLKPIELKGVEKP